MGCYQAGRRKKLSLQYGIAPEAAPPDDGIASPLAGDEAAKTPVANGSDAPHAATGLPRINERWQSTTRFRSRDASTVPTSSKSRSPPAAVLLDTTTRVSGRARAVEWQRDLGR